MPRLKNDASRRIAPPVPSSSRSPSSASAPATSSGNASWRALIDHHPDGLIVCVDAAIRFANPAAARLLGDAHPDDLIGQSLFHFAPQHTHQVLQQHRFLAECGEVPPPLDIALPRPDGLDRTVLLRSTPTRFDGCYAVETVLRDVTADRRREQSLRDAQQKAEKMNRLKSRFLAQMSHEIRTPLTSIIGFAEILSENDLGEWNEFTAYLERSSRRLLHTINSVLDLSRLEAGSLTLAPKPVDVTRVIRDTADLFTHRAAQNGVRLQVEVPRTPIRATVDPQALDRILDNLISNALKFTDEGGRVVVRAKGDGDALTLEVEDTGVGIAPQFLPHLFEAFKQGEAEARDAQPGSGLGLAITQQLVDLMGGRIDVESEEDVGTRFSITLPVS